MAVERSFLVKLVGDAKQLIQEFGKAERASEGIFGKGGLGGKLTSMLPSFKTIAVAGTAAFGAVSAAAFGAVQAAAQDQESQKKLADQLKRTTGATAEQIAAVEQHISKQMMLTGVTDDQLRPAMANLVRATGDVTFAQSQLNLALDISAATGKDLESVSLALGKAFTGNVGALTKLGIPLDQSVVKSKNLGEVIKTLNEQFGGAAADAADTFSGRLRILQVSLGEAVEGIGYALLPIAERLVAFIQSNVVPVIQAFSDKLAAGGGLRDALVAAAAQAGDFGLKVIDALEAVAKAVVSFGNVVVTVGKPLLVVIGNLAAGLTLLATLSFDKAEQVFQQFETAYLGLDKLKVSTDSVTAAFAGFRDSIAKQQKLNDALATTDRLSRQYGTTIKGTTDLNAEFAAALARLQAGAKGAAGGLDEFADGADNAGRKSGKAASDIKTFQERLKEYTSAVKSAKSASDAFGRSQERAGQARVSLAEADADLAKAQEALAAAQRGGSPEQIAAAQRGLAAAERNVSRAKFNVEESVIAVRDAERQLAELRKDPEATPDEIRKAEIRLAEAKFAVADAEDRQIEITDGLTEARRQLRIATDGLRKGDEELIPFQSAVEELTKRQEEAAKRYKEALDEQTEALKEYTDALAALQAVAATVPKFAGANPVTGLLPVPPVPTPAANGMAPNPGGQTPIVVNITAGIGGNAYQIGKELVEVLDQYVGVAGPLSSLMRVS